MAGFLFDGDSTAPKRLLKLSLNSTAVSADIAQHAVVQAAQYVAAAGALDPDHQPIGQDEQHGLTAGRAVQIRGGPMSRLRIPAVPRERAAGELSGRHGDQADLPFAVAGPMTAETSVTLSAGKPPSRACL